MEATDISGSPPTEVSSAKRWILFSFAPLVWVAYFVFAIIFEADRGPSRIIDFVAAVAINILTFAWCRTDSEERGYTLHRFFPIATIIFGFLALPYYLFRSRGFRRGMISTGWFVLYAVCSIVASGLVAMMILLALMLAGAVSADIFSG